jgi:peptidoglycan/LPS O-acetylase OafA/YrhL
VANSKQTSIIAREGHQTRPEIQALRAIAVLAVLIFHLLPHRFTGGFIGVDVFFVISGFLITSHLSRQMQGTTRFSFAQFYARRIRRLLPASLLVLMTVSIATVLFIPHALWNDIGQQIMASALLSENWVLAANAVDYLALGPTSVRFRTTGLSGLKNSSTWFGHSFFSSAPS